MSSYDVEGFHRINDRAGLWTYGKRETFAKCTEGLQNTEQGNQRLLMIDKMVMKNCKRRVSNLRVA